MANQTITQLTYDSWTAVSNQPEFLVSILIAWFIPILIYIIAGACIRGKTASGKKLEKAMIQSPNFWVGFVIFFFIQASLMLLVVFPIWLKFLI